MEIHTLWVCGHLPWFESLCLTSMAAQGHDVVVWSYDEVALLPYGVTRRPAAKILPSSAIIRHESGSLALFSNRFRYRLLRLMPVTWFDIDFLFIKPLSDDRPLLFGWEDTGSVCTAVLRLPPQNPALRDVEKLSLAKAPVPFWWTAGKRRRQWLAGLVNRHVPAQKMPWGTFGPFALTKALRQHNLLRFAQPVDTFYPIHWTESNLIFESAAVVEARIRPNTIAVHLWGDSNLGGRRREAPPPGSWLEAMCARYGFSPLANDWKFNNPAE